ncbi:uncharacterized protein LOC113554109 isoform X1 [Rhopalosiphum maidis]|uniref:uncharacterized protein LOC113554109 isoform X1 n=1 Tax=Rhopalosiphum maidis TaxID=43146 RepID=UPI000EFFB698|nr:uncharacterized protein LOC113554109 isoform X1 [Rhopalosiphum maidis]
MNFFKRYFITITITVLPIFIISSTACPPYIRTYLNDFEGVSGNFNRRNADFTGISVQYTYNKVDAEIAINYKSTHQLHKILPLDGYAISKSSDTDNARQIYFRGIFTNAKSFNLPI